MRSVCVAHLCMQQFISIVELKYVAVFHAEQMRRHIRVLSALEFEKFIFEG